MQFLVEFLRGPQDGRTYDSGSTHAGDRKYALLVWKATKNGKIGQSIAWFNPDLVSALLLRGGSQRLHNLHRHQYVVVDKFLDGVLMHVVLLYSCALLPQVTGA